METVVKTAMYEVTKLVEEGFLEEMQCRNREVESLRMQLRWAETKLSDQGVKGRKAGRCTDCSKDDLELSSNTEEERPTEQQDDIFGGCGVKEEDDSVERWSISCTQEVIPESTQAEDPPTSTFSPAMKSLTTEEDYLLPAVDVKDENSNKPSGFSLHWSGPLNGEAELESHSATEKTEAQPKQPQENSEKLLRDVIKQDPQVSAAYVFLEDHEDTHMTTDPALVEDSGWASMTVTAAGLLQNHRLATEQDCDPVQTRGPLNQTEHELSDCVTAHVDVLVTPNGDQISSSVSPMSRLQNSDALGVSIKQELIIDSDGCVESEPNKKKMTKSRMASFSCSVKQHRGSSEALKQNRISHKNTVQEVMKLHSKVGTGLRLQAAIQHLHRPMKKASHTYSNSGNAALSIAHSHVANLNSLTRTSIHI
ncbi:uncharacterized protein LOC117737874 isoform X2 [Cyclopterus lumpus]|nr:uncharacterized protein LOC117737874 isoform X2 [Cyclopterus lumpus]